MSFSTVLYYIINLNCISEHQCYVTLYTNVHFVKCLFLICHKDKTTKLKKKIGSKQFLALCKHILEILRNNFFFNVFYRFPHDLCLSHLRSCKGANKVLKLNDRNLQCRLL